MRLHNDSDCIHKQLLLRSPRSRVWRALTDYREFSAWFGVDLESPFVVGHATSGQITNPGYEHIRMEVIVQTLEPERYFSYTWHPYAIEPGIDYAKETPTLVEFTLEDKGGETLLTITESGFEKLPPHRRDEAFRMDDKGWSTQLKDIEEHVTRAS